MPVTVDPAPAGPPGSADPPPIDPLAVTIAATQPPDPPAVASTPPPEISSVAAADAVAGEIPQSTARFVPVRPGELDQAPPEPVAGSWISPQTAALVIGLLAVWLLAWYMLQPPSADGLYRRIQRQTEGESAEGLQQAEDDIRQFLARFPNDSRSEGLKGYAERIEVSRLDRRLELQAKGMNLETSLSPVERSYLDALNTARIDPEAGMAKLQAMIDLFEPAQDASGPDSRCIQLARRRLGEFRQQYEAQSQEQLTLVVERLNRADELHKTDPPRAKAIYHAVVVLYQNKAWAKDVVQRARAALEEK
jgi:serine/threonine-protein kinase